MNDPRLLIVHADSSARTLMTSMLRSSERDPGGGRQRPRGRPPPGPRPARRDHRRGRPGGPRGAGTGPVREAEAPEAAGDPALLGRPRRADPRGPPAGRRRGPPLPGRRPPSCGRPSPRRWAARARPAGRRRPSSRSAPEPTAVRDRRLDGPRRPTRRRRGGRARGGRAGGRPSRRGLVGEDESLRQAIELAETIAPTRAPVLVQGEVGTGKRRVARALHHQSSRRRGPFVEVRAADDPGEELDRVLFGERPLIGPPVPGKLDEAAGGTLYIDDVGGARPRGPGPAPPAPPRRRVRAGRRQPAGRGRRPARLRDPGRPGRGGRSGRLPPGPLLPDQRRLPEAAAAPAPRRRRRAARRALPGPRRPPDRPAGRRLQPRGARPAPPLPLARQRPGAGGGRRARRAALPGPADRARRARAQPPGRRRRGPRRRPAAPTTSGR